MSGGNNGENGEKGLKKENERLYMCSSSPVEYGDVHMLIGRMTRQWVKVMWQTSARTDTPSPAIRFMASSGVVGNGEETRPKRKWKENCHLPRQHPIDPLNQRNAGVSPSHAQDR